MIQVPEELPVPKHHTMKVVDSSKIQAFQDCPRGFFFRYVLGLQKSGPNIHLDFGSAWHDAMETLLLEGYSEEGVALAYMNFLETYREAFPDPVTDPDNAPKNPEYAYKALNEYVKQYESDNFEVLYTETAGLVPVSETRDLAVKLDSIVRDKNSGEIMSMEHKTTGRNSKAWREKWSFMLQVESYTHLLYSLYPAENVGKVMINGSVFTKSRTWDGVRIPVHKSKKQMASFLWNVNHWIDMIEWNYNQLAKMAQNPMVPVMKAFPINCSSCSKYGCRMGGICSTFPNPVDRFVEQEGDKKVVKPPAGYEVEFWDPLRRNTEKADNIVEKSSDGSVKIREKSEEEKQKDEDKVRKSREQEEESEEDDFSYLMKPEDN